MDLFTKLLGDLLIFVYHCFDRIVIHGYLSGLSRPEQVVYFFRQVLGVPVVSKEVLRQRTGPRRACARRTMFNPGYARWCEGTLTASTSSSRAWSRGRAIVSQCRSYRGSQLPHLGPPEEPVHPQLFLHPR